MRVVMTQVLILVNMSFCIDILLNLEHVNVFFAKSSADSELVLAFILDTINIKVSVVFLKVQLTKVECLSIFGPEVGEQSQITLASLILIDPLRGYEHITQIKFDLLFTEFHCEVRDRSVDFSAWLVENCGNIWFEDSIFKN